MFTTMSMKTVAPVRVVCSFPPSSPREAVFLSPSFSYFLFFDSRREQDINNFARREITRKNCPPRGLSYYINSHHIDGILSAFRRDCFSIDVARRARLLHDGTGERRNGRERERERERDSAILERSFSSLLVLLFLLFSSSLVFWTLIKNETKSGRRTNKLSFDGNIK